MTGSNLIDAIPASIRLEDVVRCPECGHDGMSRTSASVTCPVCAREYGVDHGILDLAPPGVRDERTVSQRVRESRLYSRIYEDVMRDDPVPASDLLSLKRARAILDVPCGTGHRARRLARACATFDHDVTIIAADVSWATLETARQYLKSDGLQESVHLLRVPANRLPIATATFDRVHCAGALHLAHDIDEALGEFARVLQPGGICVITTVVMGAGLVGRALRRLAEVPSGFHWFGPDELPGRMAAQGLAVYAEHVHGEALTVAARRV